MTSQCYNHIIFRASYRGSKENDHILGSFAKKKFQDLPHEDQKNFEEMLMLDDQTLWQWIVLGDVVTDVRFSEITKKIREFHGIFSS